MSSALALQNIISQEPSRSTQDHKPKNKQEELSLTRTIESPGLGPGLPPQISLSIQHQSTSLTSESTSATLINNQNIDQADQVMTMLDPFEKLEKIAEGKMRDASWLLFYNSMGYLTVFLHRFNILSSQGTLFALFVFSLAMLTCDFLSKEKATFSTTQGRKKCFRMAQWVALSQYFLCFALKYTEHSYSYSLSLCTIIGWTVTIAETIYVLNDPTEKQRNIKTLLKYSLWAQLTFIALSADNIIACYWVFILSPVLLSAFMSSMLSIIFLFIFISTICGYSCYNAHGKPVILGSAWYLLSTISFALWGFVMVFVGAANSSFTGISSIFSWRCIIGLTLSLFLVVYTKVTKESLLLFLKYEALDTMEELKALLTTEEYEVKYHYKDIRECRYLTKVTSTYFSATKMVNSQEAQPPNSPNSPNSRKMMRKSVTLDLEGQYRQEEPSLSLKPDHKSFEVEHHNLSLRKKQKSNTEEEKDSCFVCESSEADAVVMDCGHGGICHECAMEGWKKSDKCHMCRGVITRILQVRNLPGLNVVKIVNETEKLYVKVPQD